MHKILGHACSAQRSTNCAVHVQKTNAVVWEPLLLPLLERHPALIPTTRLKHLQKQRPEQEFGLVKPTRMSRVQQRKALHGSGCDLPSDVLALRDQFLSFYPGLAGAGHRLEREPFKCRLFQYSLA
jgi:hypothetical protein